MSTVQTLRGPLDVTALGVTLMHEHIALVDYDLMANDPSVRPRDADVATGRERLRDAKRSGVDTIVDMTVIGLNRNVPLVRRFAADADVNVLLATGIFTLDELPRYFRNRGPGTLGGGPDAMAELFVREVETGIGDTGAQAAVLKCATGPLGLTEGVERAMRAVGQAHRETGVPISTHSDAGTRRGLDQQRTLAAEGVDLTRVVIGHCDGTTDLDYLRALMDAGSCIGIDRFGMEQVAPLHDRVEVVATLVSLGYADRIVLSHDTSCLTHTFDEEARRAVLPDWTYSYLPDVAVPHLVAAGVTQADLHQMLVLNPQRMLCPTTPY